MSVLARGRSNALLAGLLSAASSTPSGVRVRSDAHDARGDVGQDARERAYAEVTVICDQPLVGIVGMAGMDAMALLAKTFEKRWLTSVVVTCTTDDDRRGPNLAELRKVLREARKLHVEYPIRDREPPAQLFGTVALVRLLRSLRQHGRPLLIACGAGCGRSGLLAACLLTTEGASPQAAIARVDDVRRSTLRSVLDDEQIVEEASQRAFVDLFARAWAAVAARSVGDALCQPLAGSIDAVDDRELAAARTNLVAHCTREAALVALVTLAAADRRGRLSAALRKAADELRRDVGDDLAALAAHDIDSLFAPGRKPASTLVLADLRDAYRELRSESPPSGHGQLIPLDDRRAPVVTSTQANTSSERTSAHAGDPRGDAVVTATDSERAKAPSDAASQAALSFVTSAVARDSMHEIRGASPPPEPSANSEFWCGVCPPLSDDILAAAVALLDPVPNEQTVAIARECISDRHEIARDPRAWMTSALRRAQLDSRRGAINVLPERAELSQIDRLIEAYYSIYRSK